MKKLLFCFIIAILSSSLFAQSCSEVSDIKKYFDFLKNKKVIKVKDLEKKGLKSFEWTNIGIALVMTGAANGHDKDLIRKKSKYSKVMRRFRINEFDTYLEAGNYEMAKKSLDEAMEFDSFLPEKNRLKNINNKKGLRKIGMNPIKKSFFVNYRKPTATKQLSTYKKTVFKIGKVAKKNKYTLITGAVFTTIMGLGILPIREKANIHFGKNLVENPEDIALIDDEDKLRSICLKIQNDENIKQSVHAFRDELETIAILSRNKTDQEIAKMPKYVNDDFRGISSKEGSSSANKRLEFINKLRNKSNKK